MTDNLQTEQVQLMGPGGRWAAAADGGTIMQFAQFLHQPSGREVPVHVRFERNQGASHLHNELAEFHISPDAVHCDIARGLPSVYCERIQAMLVCLLPQLEQAELAGGFQASLGDEGLNARVLSFCAIVPDFLIPDPYFIHSYGYAAERTSYPNSKPWEERQDCAYWRGTDTGVWRYREIEMAPRVGICRLAQAFPGVINAAITRVEARPDHELKRAYYENMGYFGVEEGQSNILDYRYQVDIDGNTSTWSSFFLKLLSGSPVLKVESECNWRQWYYHKLKPGEHFVPVRADLGDFMDQLDWLRNHPEEAKRIGAAGAAFAQSISLEEAIADAGDTISRLLALNRRVIFE